jgi:hypothetical protein
MSSLGRFGARRLVVIGAAAALSSGLASGLTGALVASPASAATFTVRCTAGQPNDLQATMEAAPPGSTIYVSGTCTGQDNTAGGNYTIDKNLTLANGSQNAHGNQNAQGGAILDGNNFGSVLQVNSGVTATITSLTIQHGNDADGGFGGGIHNMGILNLISSKVANNTANFRGGGVYNDGASGTNATANITSSLIVNNTSTFIGGGIINEGDLSGNATLNLTRSQVVNNTAIQAGGGIFNDGEQGGQVTANLSSSLLANNNAPNDFGQGGGIYNDGSNSGSATANFNSSRVLNNTATINGGGIYNDLRGGGIANVTMQNSIVSLNVSNGGPGSGGGIFNFPGATVTLQDGSQVFRNAPDNCDPSGSVNGCTN